MNIRLVSVLVLVVFLSGMFIPACFADDCGITKTDIIKSIIAHITQRSDITREQVIHLIKAYLGSADCGSDDVKEAKEKADNIDNNVIPRCSDGTLFAHCSTKDKPKYCYSGRLVDRCDLCCESGRCGPDGRCEGPEDTDADDVACTGSTKPRCCAIGSRSEGWYQDGKLIKWDNCGGCYAVCKAVGTKSEGWYSSCDGKLILYDKCVEPFCEDLCGDGVCQEVVCHGPDCPCAETSETCPEDCCVNGDGVCRDGCTPENDDDCETGGEAKVETICTDGIDNDGDGLVDNEDGDCWIREGATYMEDLVEYCTKDRRTQTFKDYIKLLPTLKALGIETIELTPVFEHCNAEDQGWRWGVKDYYKIDPNRGTEVELSEFLNKAHSLGIKVVTMISVEDSTSVSDKKCKLLGTNGWWAIWLYDKDEIGGHLYQYQKSHPEKDILLKDSDGKYLCHSVGWGYAVDCNSEDVINLWEDIFTNIMSYGFDGIRLDSPDQNYCHKDEKIYLECNEYSCPEPIIGEHSNLPLYRILKNLTEPQHIFISENPSTQSLKHRWGCELPYYPPYTDMDEIAEVSEDYGFTQLLQKHIAVDEPDPKVNSKYLVNWINTQYKDHVLDNRERYRFCRNWNYYLPEHTKFITNNPRYYSAATLVSTVPGIPKVTEFELFGTSWFPENAQEKRYDYWKKLLSIRNKHNALRYGSIENVWKSGDNTYAYLREYKDEKVIVVINFLDKEATSYLDLSFFPKGTVLYDDLNDEKFTIDNPSNFKISVPKYGSRILVLK